MTPWQRHPVRVIFADDQEVCRAAIRELIEATPGLALVGEATSGQEAIDVVTELRPDLVLMDVRMPGVNGFEAATILVQSRRDLVLVLMSADPIELPPGFPPNGGQVLVVTKQELSPRTLLDLWHARRTR